MGFFGRSTAPASADSAKTIVAHGCEIRGDLGCQGSLHIDGVVDGRLKVAQGVTIGKEGRFDGEADVSHLLLSGELRGRVHCRHASILVGGLFRGELFCESLTVEEGGRFDGICTHQAYEPESDASTHHPKKSIEQSSAQPQSAAIESKELNTSS